MTIFEIWFEFWIIFLLTEKRKKIVIAYLKVWTARGEDDFVGLKILPLRRECAVNQRAAL